MKTGLLIGAVGGAIAGAAGGAAAAEFCTGGAGGCSYPSDSEQLAMGAAGAVLGALIGGGLGAAIAAPIRQWGTVYQRDTRVVPVVSANRIGIALSILPPKR